MDMTRERGCDMWIMRIKGRSVKPSSREPFLKKNNMQKQESVEANANDFTETISLAHFSLHQAS